MTDKKRKIINIVLFAVFLMVVFSLLIFDFLLNKNYNSLYGNDVTMEDCVLDLKNLDCGSTEWRKGTQSVALMGETEFFYNKWIVTDGGEAGEPDGRIKITQPWTDIKKDGKRLSRKGYASYRYRIINNKYKTDYVAVLAKEGFTAWRVFVDGILVSEYGTMSKTKEGGNVDGAIKHHFDFIAEPGGSYEVVIELGYTEAAGGAPYRIGVTPHNKGMIEIGIPNFNSQLRVVFYLAMGMLLASIAILLLFAFATRKYAYSLSFVAVIIMLIAVLSFSSDSMSLQKVGKTLLPYEILPVCAFIVDVLTGIVFAAHLFIGNRIQTSKKGIIVWVGGNVIFNVLEGALTGFTAQLWVIIAHVLWYDYLFYKLISAKNSVFEKIAYSIILLTLSWVCEMEAVEFLGFIVFSAHMAYSIAMILAMFGIVGVCFVKFYELNNSALQAERANKAKAVFRAQVLKSQIKPHFIFNMLTLIKNAYRDDTQKGESILMDFSNYMRANVSADGLPLVTFEEELNNVDTYFRLYNERKDGRLVLNHNIDEYDFLVPPLSVQPLVENAIKYAHTEDKEDGAITINSYSDEKYIYVEVVDNGVGFDVNAIGAQSVGLKNARERFSILLQAEMTIESEIGKGTKITIKIPRGTSNERNSG